MVIALNNAVFGANFIIVNKAEFIIRIFASNIIMGNLSDDALVSFL